MEEFCGSTFWDWNLTWSNDNDTGISPDFPQCFEQTVLTWIPCLFLLLFAGLDIYYSLTSRMRNIPWTGLNCTKIAITVLLAILQLLLLAYHTFLRDNAYMVYPVERYTPIIRIVTLCLALFLILFGKIKGIRSSGIQFLFWILLTICEAFSFRTAILNSSVDGKQEDVLVFVVAMIFYPLIVCQLLLHCFADAEPAYQENTQILERPSPEKGASFLSSLVFFWFESLAWKGYRKPLDYADLWDLNPEDKSNHLVPIFNKRWSQALGKGKVAQEAKATFRKRSGSIDFKNTQNAGEKTRKQKSLFPVIMKVFGPTFFFGAFLKLLQDLLTFVSPQILKLLIAYVEGGEADWKGYFYAILLFVASTVQTLILAQYFHRMFLVGMRMRTTLVGAIYRKALYVSSSSRKETTGEIVNLMSVDVQRLMDLTIYVNILWSSPLQIALSLYFLWNTLGPSVLAGLGMMILLIPFNAIIASRIEKLQVRQLKYKDQRVKLMNEILSGIKVLKLYAWEPSFEEQVIKIRAKEIKVLKDTAYFNAGISFVWTCAPFLVSLVTFATYVLSDEKNVLDAEKVFVSLTLFNIMRMPLTILPMMMMFTIQGKVSLARLNKFMNADEIDPDAVSHDPQENDPIVVENATFNWEPDIVSLRNINLRVKQGSLVAIVGTVGSGKSTLLSAILGELDKQSGRVNTKGQIAYVAQQAWIQNATLRENILFGRPFEPSKYDKMIDACALKPDLDILPGGDQTEIGEKGINLSGGQKQRVSLARATYSNADLYLLDDPLSAVDSHVGKHIFENVIGPKGLLKKRTRLLVTHGINFLPEMDNIVVMKDGEISEFGTYKELLSKKGAFSDFLLQHIGSTDEEIEDENIIHDLKKVIGADVETIIARQRSRISESDTGGEQGVFRRQISTLSQESGEKPSPLRRMSSKVPDAEEKVALLKVDDKLIEAEKTETGSVNLGVYKHYIRAVGPWMTCWGLFFHLIFQMFAVVSNVWLSNWANEPIINGTREASQTNMYLGVYGGLGIGEALAVMAASIVLALGTLRASSILHSQMLNHVLKSPMWFFDTTPIGRILNRFAKDVDVTDNQLPQNMRSFLSCMFEVIATLAVISYSTPIFISVIVPTGVIYYCVQRFYVATSRQLKRLESVSRSPIYSHFGETLTGSSTIRAYSMQDRFTLESETKVDHNQIAYYPSIICNRWLAVRLETVGNILIFFAALFAVIGRRSMNSGIVGLSITYALQITQTLNWLVRMSSDVETNIVAVERIKEYGETPQEAAWEIQERKPPKTWPESGAVVFDHFQSRYREGLELVLRDVTCKIEPAEKIGIVGRTGAGKSSLTLGLFRIVEAAGGSIVIDGQNISKLGLHDLRGRLTIIPQDPVLFSGTLRINLDPFHSYSDETVWRALELSHLKSFVKGLSARLEHEVSEGGENLSVGQRQLICLARALLRKTKILVLDEATAAVDLETDDLIQQTIRSEFKDSTILTIAHRLNTIMDSSRVMVLDKGEIREFDTPETLLQNKKSIFYGMAKDAGLV